MKRVQLQSALLYSMWKRCGSPNWHLLICIQSRMRGENEDKSSLPFISLSFSMLFSTSYPLFFFHCHSLNSLCNTFIISFILFFLFPHSYIFLYTRKNKIKDAKMNTFGSELGSSGCESGWTLYLEHSFLNQNASSHHKDKRFKDEDSGEEDLSMLSDASSGPPLFPHYDSYFKEDVNACFYSASKAVKLAKSAKKKQKVKENQHLEDQHLTFLHDTATSPVFDFSTVCSVFWPCMLFPPFNVFSHSSFLNKFPGQCCKGQPTNICRECGWLFTRFFCNLFYGTSLCSLLFISPFYTSSKDYNHSYSFREDRHSKKNTSVSYNQKMKLKATSKLISSFVYMKKTDF